MWGGGGEGLSHAHVSQHSTHANKTGLQTVSRPVERVHYLGGWSGGLFWQKKCSFRESAKRKFKNERIFGGKNHALQSECSKRTFKIKVLRKNHQEVL